MATPQYDAIKAKVRDWSNRREVATVPESVIEDCLQYGNDDIYRYLRIPQLEYTLQFTVDSTNNTVKSYSEFDVPEDLIEFIYLLKRKPDGTVEWMYNQVNDVRTFLDPYADQYNWFRYVWKDLKFLVSPQLKVGDVIELHYYRRLGQLDALYSVVPENYSFDYNDEAQPLLESVVSNGTNLYKVTGGTTNAVFATSGEAAAYAVTNGGSVTSVMFVGREAWNWLRDAHERLIIFAALRHVAAYLNFPEMEKRYADMTEKTITDLNREEKFRRAKGGNVQINVNTGGLI
ncbi:MAG TPA: hypothetical protein P5539_05745 [Mesotoga sp.]|nr:hypothetical protein [Mesotoga sp.]